MLPGYQLIYLRGIKGWILDSVGAKSTCMCSAMPTGDGTRDQLHAMWYVVFAGGGPLPSQSRLQTTVATSGMESELMALYGSMQELVWLRGVMKELGLPILEPTPSFLDSQSAQDLAMNPVFHKRSKHIAIKYHWVRHHIVGGIFGTARLVRVDTLEMTADIFTTALSGLSFVTHRDTTSGTKRSRSSVVESRQPKKVRKR